MFALIAAVAAALPLSAPAPRAMAHEITARAMSPEIVKAWEKAGATYSRLTPAQDGEGFYFVDGPAKAGDFPGFCIPGNLKLADLPDPAVPFGLVYTDTKDADFKPLAAFKRLQILNLVDTYFTDAGLKDMAALEELRVLRLGGTKVTDAGLKHLASLKQLQWLDLTLTLVTDEGLKELAPLDQLQMLDLWNTQVTDEGLKEIATFKHLQSYLFSGVSGQTSSGPPIRTRRKQGVFASMLLLSTTFWLLLAP